MRYDVSAEELREFLHGRRIKVAAADRLANVNAGRTQSYILGRSKINPEYLDALARGLGSTSWAELETIRASGSSSAAHSKESIAQLPYAGVVPASTAWGDPLAGSDVIGVDSKFAGANRFVAKVRGASCFPYIMEADHLVFEVDLVSPPGTIVLAQRKGDHGCTVKLLDVDPVTGIPSLVPLNPETEPPSDGDGWGAIAKVVGLIRDVEGAELTIYHRAGIRPKMIPIAGGSSRASALGVAKAWAGQLKGKRQG